MSWFKLWRRADREPTRQSDPRDRDRIHDPIEAEKEARGWEELFNEEASENRERQACRDAGQEYQAIAAWAYKK